MQKEENKTSNHINLFYNSQYLYIFINPIILVLHPGGLGNSSKKSRSRGGEIGRAKAWTSSSEVRGTLWTKARSRDEAESIAHRVSAANRCGRTSARPNKLRQGRIKRNQARERVSHLRTVLGTARRGF
jgi:hypothetical protein